jgi:hypothetical protein
MATVLKPGPVLGREPVEAPRTAGVAAVEAELVLAGVVDLALVVVAQPLFLMLTLVLEELEFEELPEVELPLVVLLLDELLPLLEL